MKIRRKTSKRRTSDALQFAPNFTAHLLPPDVVCLYPPVQTTLARRIRWNVDDREYDVCPLRVLRR